VQIFLAYFHSTKCSILIHNPGAATIGQLMAYVPSGLSHPTPKNKTKKQANKQTPCPESTSELYQPSDRRLSVKLVPVFADRGYHVMIPAAVFSDFQTEAATFSFK
jgi:hypothetical protein